MLGGIYSGATYLAGFLSLESAEPPPPPPPILEFAGVIEWELPGSKRYETGIDRGVLYLDDGQAVPWNGLTSVDETVNRETSSVYFDGMKISTSITLGDYQATVKAFTYPDEFEELQGFDSLIEGVYLDNQPIESFGLAYRTMIGDDVGGLDGYKIHILWNVMVLPKDRTYPTIGADISIVEFEWDISAVQEEVDGFSPTSHFVIDSTKVRADVLSVIEKLLYGDAATNTPPALPSMDDFVTLLMDLQTELGVTVMTIVDNGDGTWTATTEPGFDDLIAIYGDTYDITDTIVDGVTFISITDNGDGTWTATTEDGHDDLIVVTGDTYDISDTTDEISIVDNGDGTWTATTEGGHDDLIIIHTDGSFEIFDATANFDANGSFVILDATASFHGKGYFEIFDANVEYEDDKFAISNTVQ